MSAALFLFGLLLFDLQVLTAFSNLKFPQFSNLKFPQVKMLNAGSRQTNKSEARDKPGPHLLFSERHHLTVTPITAKPTDGLSDNLLENQAEVRLNIIESPAG